MQPTLHGHTAAKPATRANASVSRKLAEANLKSSLPRRRKPHSVRRKSHASALQTQHRSELLSPTKYRRNTRRRYLAAVIPADGRLVYLRKYRRGAPRLKMLRTPRGLARQAMRKIRAVSSTKHSALRRRLTHFN